MCHLQPRPNAKLFQTTLGTANPTRAQEPMNTRAKAATLGSQQGVTLPGQIALCSATRVWRSVM